MCGSSLCKYKLLQGTQVQREQWVYVSHAFLSGTYGKCVFLDDLGSITQAF